MHEMQNMDNVERLRIVFKRILEFLIPPIFELPGQLLILEFIFLYSLLAHRIGPNPNRK